MKKIVFIIVVLLLSIEGFAQRAPLTRNRTLVPSLVSDTVHATKAKIVTAEVDTVKPVGIKWQNGYYQTSPTEVDIVAKLSGTNFVRAADTTALKAISSDSVQMVYLNGYTSSSLVGGGFFIKKRKSDYPLNSITTFEANQVSGDSVWVREEYLQRNIVYARWGGTIKDSDVLASAVANQTAINNASLVASLSGGTVWIDENLYVGGLRVVDSLGLLAIRSNCTYDGGGVINIVSNLRNQSYHPNGWRLFYGDSVVNVTMKNLTINGNAQNNLAWATSSTMTQIQINEGEDISFSNITQLDNPGRNGIVVGTGSGVAKNVRIENCVFRNFGYAIPNNNQSDMSVLYLVGTNMLVNNNLFTNDNAFSVATNGYGVCAIEFHGNNSVISHNSITNVECGIIITSAETDIGDVVASNNSIESIKLGIFIDAFSGKTTDNVTVSNNLIHLVTKTTNSSYGFGIQLTNTSGTIRNVSLSTNKILIDTSATGALTEGINISSGQNVDVANNIITGKFRYGIAMSVQAATGLLSNLRIVGNRIEGLAASGITLYSETNLSGLSIEQNFIKIPAKADETSLSDNGINLGSSGGRITDLRIAGNIVDAGAIPASKYVVAPIDSFFNRSIQPNLYWMYQADSITGGTWDTKDDLIQISDPDTNAYFKVVSVSGARASQSWAGTSVYSVGMWVKTSATKYLECIVGGTSGSVEPNPSTLGARVVDGTVVWRYRSATTAVFTNIGN
jgi:hypothetical protein